MKVGALLAIAAIVGVIYFFIRTGKRPSDAVKSIFKRGGGGGPSEH